jgi:hypothetical protein
MSKEEDQKLILCIHKQDIKGITDAIRDGANINLDNCYLIRSLSYWDSRVSLDFIKFLISEGVNIRVNNDELFVRSCVRSEVDIVEYLLYYTNIGNEYKLVAGALEDRYDMFSLKKSVRDVLSKFLRENKPWRNKI